MFQSITFQTTNQNLVIIKTETPKSSPESNHDQIVGDKHYSVQTCIASYTVVLKCLLKEKAKHFCIFLEKNDDNAKSFFLT